MIKYLNLENFRKHEKLKLEFTKEKVFITGENAVGKTSILEAIYFALTTRSFRTTNTNDLIKEQKLFLKVDLKINDDLVEIVKTEKSKRLLLNKVVVNKVSSYLGTFPVISFSKDDQNLINQTPQFRREYFDFAIMQLDTRYAALITRYQRVLKERNALLKNIDQNSDFTFLEIITDKLIDLGERIIEKRSLYNKMLNDSLSKLKYTFFNKDIKVIYNPDTELENLEKQLKNNYKKEIEYGQTLQGPQKDDYRFYYNDKEIKTFASSGETQMMLLKIKYAQINILEQILKKDIIFLIDDLTQTLDNNNIIKILMEMPKNLNVIISAASYDISNELGFQKINIESEV